MVHILDSSHLVEIIHTDIIVKQLCDRGAPRRNEGEQVYQLRLPPLTKGLWVDRVGSYVQRPPIDHDAHFNVDPDLTVLALYLHVAEPGGHPAILMFIPLSTIRRTVERISSSSSPPVSPSPISVYWDDWGADGVRLVLLPFPNGFRCISALGPRVALTFSRRSWLKPRDACDVLIFDVHRRLETSDRAGSAGPEALGPSDMVWVSDCYTAADTVLFCSPVHTRMPYRVVRKQFSAQELPFAAYGIELALIHDGIVNLPRG